MPNYLIHKSCQAFSVHMHTVSVLSCSIESVSTCVLHTECVYQCSCAYQWMQSCSFIFNKIFVSCTSKSVQKSSSSLACVRIKFVDADISQHRVCTHIRAPEVPSTFAILNPVKMHKTVINSSLIAASRKRTPVWSIERGEL